MPVFPHSQFSLGGDSLPLYRLFDHAFDSFLDSDSSHAAEEAPPAPIMPDYYTPRWKRACPFSNSIFKCDEELFQVKLDVRKFAPDEITVKAANGFIIMEGKNDIQQNGQPRHQSCRKCILPTGCKVELADSMMSNGVLWVRVPRRAGPDVAGERIIPIQLTGPQLAGGDDEHGDIMDLDRLR